MNEFAPQPLQAEPSAPRYSRGAEFGLQVAKFIQVNWLIAADFGHGLIQGVLFASQFAGFLSGERDDVEFEPDPHGVSLGLDRLEDDARRKLRRIQAEMAIRRSRRQRPA